MTAQISHLNACVKAAKKIVDTVRERCAALVKAIAPQVSGALRAEVQKRGVSYEALFDELAAGQERISEAQFQSKVSALEGLALQVGFSSQSAITVRNKS